jgi:integrase
MSRRESPKRRVNPSGRVVWIARYTARDGRRIAKPAWNGGKGTFDLRRDAQRAIDEAYQLPERSDTVGAYFATWTDRHPRADRTNATNDHRVGRVLDVEVDGILFRDWPLHELRRRHALALLDHMLRIQRRAVTGARGILSSLSALLEDAITDELADVNPFKGVRVRANDIRARKQPRQVRVFGFEEMHRFATAGRREIRRTAKRPDGKVGYPAHDFEALLRTFTDTGMRLGEILPLRRQDFDGQTFQVRRTAHEGTISEGTKTDHGEATAGRVVPCPPGLAALIAIAPVRIDSELLFPTPTGKLWRERVFSRDVWKPTQEISGIDMRPHEARHSYISHLRAAGVDDADLADIAGHRVETMISRYTHPIGESFDRVREVIG